MGIFSFIIKRVVPIPRFMDYQSFAFVGAHPDDIEVACGATVARLSRLGKRICYIIATDGRYGTDDINMSTDKLISIREAEAISAAKVMGVEDVRFLGFPDGGNYSVNDMKDKIAIELAKFKPDIVFTSDNHMKAETHPDHINVGRATEIAMLYCIYPLMMRDLGMDEIANPKGIAYYYTDKPNTFYKLSKADVKKREESLAEHKSQFLCSDERIKEFNLLNKGLKLLNIRYGLRRLTRYADSYRVLSNMHMHCVTDASKF